MRGAQVIVFDGSEKFTESILSSGKENRMSDAINVAEIFGKMYLMIRQ